MSEENTEVSRRFFLKRGLEVLGAVTAGAVGASIENQWKPIATTVSYISRLWQENRAAAVDQVDQLMDKFDHEPTTENFVTVVSTYNPPWSEISSLDPREKTPLNSEQKRLQRFVGICGQGFTMASEMMGVNLGISAVKDNKKEIGQQLAEESIICKNSAEFSTKVKALKGYKNSKDNIGWAFYDSKLILIDIEEISKSDFVKQLIESGQVSSGKLLMQALFHEWLHLLPPYTTRSIPTIFFDGQIQHEKVAQVRGTEIISDGKNAYKRTNDVIINAIDFFFQQRLGFANMQVLAYYDSVGVDLLTLFCILKDDVPQLYQLYYSSNMVDLAKMLGYGLPGEQSDLDKGVTYLKAMELGDKDKQKAIKFVNDIQLIPYLENELYSLSNRFTPQWVEERKKELQGYH